MHAAIRVSSLFALAAGLPLPAQAQVVTSPDDAAPERARDDFGSGQIIVTAQRRAENLQETPVAVTALSGQAIADLGISEVEDLARAVPNLQLLPISANPSTLQVGLRGGSEQVGGLITSEPVVGIYIDDVYRARLQGSNTQLGDIERIEVLRGPQGTLYGRNNFSGAIKIITRTPSPDDEWFNASVGYGSFEEVRAQASLGRALTDTLGASLSVLYRDVGEGYIFNRAQDQFVGREENLVARAKLAYDNGDLEMVAGLTYSRDRNDGYIPVAARFPRVPTGRDTAVSTGQARPRYGSEPYVTQSPQESLGRTETIAASLDVSYDFGNLTARAITGYVDLEDEFRWDLVSGLEVGPGVYSPGFDRDSDATSQQFTQELQLLGDLIDGDLEFILGAFYFHEDGTQTIVDTIPVFGLPRLDPTFLAIETESWAVFAQATYNLTDRLSATLGGRYTEDRKRFDASIQSGFGAPNPRTEVALDETFTSFTPKFGLDYEFSDTVFGFASVSKGFKAGGFNGLSVLNPLVLRTVYEPQDVWAYEAGLKTEWWSRRVRLNITAFYNELSSLQQTALLPPASFPTQNVGDAEILGVEAELLISPEPGFDVFANVGYQDGDYVSLIPTAQAATAGATDLPLVTNWTLQAGFTYEGELAGALIGRFGLDGRYTGDSFVEVTNSLIVEGYTRFNTFVALGTLDERWELKFEVQNLTDEVTFVSGIVSLPVPGLTVLKPRTWLLSLNYDM